MRRRHHGMNRRGRPRGRWEPWQVASARTMLRDGWTAEKYTAQQNVAKAVL